MTEKRTRIYPIVVVLLTAIAALLAVSSRRKISQYAINTDL